MLLPSHVDCMTSQPTDLILNESFFIQIHQTNLMHRAIFNPLLCAQLQELAGGCPCKSGSLRGCEKKQLFFFFFFQTQQSRTTTRKKTFCIFVIPEDNVSFFFILALFFFPFSRSLGCSLETLPQLLLFILSDLGGMCAEECSLKKMGNVRK